MIRVTSSPSLVRWAAAGGLVLLAGSAAPSEPAPPAARADPRPTVTVVAGPRYAAGPLHRFVLGTRYRTTWTAPIEVEVLDLGTYAGGLTPDKKGGGKQTKSLALKSADGREFRFRSVDKDPSPVLPEDLHDTVADWIAQDQISAALPTAPLVVESLSEAAGVFSVKRELYVMPDDPRLGEFRQEFAGMLGTFEEDPDEKSPTFEALGFVEIVNAEDLIEKLDASPRDQVDTAAFLKARLFDMFIGDWDRHWDQWDWGRKDGQGRWLPLPKDRDNAFTRFDGLLLGAGRFVQPRFVKFGSEYPDMVGLNWNQRFIDRRLLAGVDWPAWAETARELQARLTDEAIARAVRRMPEGHYRVSGPLLARRLEARRDALPEAAREYYELLADQVTVQGTDAPELATVVRAEDGQVEVTLAEKGAENGAYFRRRFSPRDTREVRIDLAGGDDQLVTRGRGPDQVKVRVVGGPGNDVLDDSQGGNTELFDHEGENRIVHGPGTSDSDKPYEHPLTSKGNPDRDWGDHHLPTPIVAGGGDLGVVLGARLQRTRYGFRKHPYAARHTAGVEYSTALQGFRLEYDAEYQRTNSRKRVNLFARASDIEVVRFHGFGNETSDDAGDRFYRNEQRQFLLAPSLTLPLSAARFAFGPVAKYSTTRPPTDGFLARNDFYGDGGFGQVGARARLWLDRRDSRALPRKGAFVFAEGTYYPEAWSLRRDFGEVHGEAITYLGIPGLPATLALRAGGKRVWGDYPFHESAFIGGPGSVRGLRRQRYAGDAAAFGNAELRVPVARVKLLIPTTIAVFGLVDTGRVFLDGEGSNRWHTGVGGGLSLMFYRPENTLTLAAARSEGNVRLYLYGGVAF
ncbi:MAG TPA: BamA/TamA family outer membrane protein [Vicinamibacteria bacterium]|nr:BamA/TamA family outer membrane protein [Vicinamibacteria bacterium]